MTPEQEAKLRQYAEAFADAVNGRRRLYAEMQAGTLSTPEYVAATARVTEASWACGYGLAAVLLEHEWMIELAALHGAKEKA